jgi:hypothetical protein
VEYQAAEPIHNFIPGCSLSFEGFGKKVGKRFFLQFFTRPDESVFAAI